MIPTLLAAQIARRNRAQQKAQLKLRKERLLAKAKAGEEGSDGKLDCAVEHLTLVLRRLNLGLIWSS